MGKSKSVYGHDDGAIRAARLDVSGPQIPSRRLNRAATAATAAHLGAPRRTVARCGAAAGQAPCFSNGVDRREMVSDPEAVRRRK